MKRICLFAGYNYNNVLSNYVIDYLKELSYYCDIFYLADGFLPQSEIKKIEPYTKVAIIENHKGYDFYSWKLLFQNYVGIETISKYDELIFANDSCFCVNSFKPIFEDMSSKEFDFWGLSAADNKNVTDFSIFEEYVTKNKPEFYIGSYFMVFRAKFFLSDCFIDFINKIDKNDRKEVFKKYEVGILKIALENGFSTGCWDNLVRRYSTVYMRDAFNLIKNGYPLLKVRIFIDNIGGQSLVEELAEVSEKFCDYKYLKYINDVRNERYHKQVENKKISSQPQITFNVDVGDFFPPILLQLYNSISKTFMAFVYAIYKYLCPRILKKLYVAIIKNQSINNVNQIKFNSLSRPPYKGWYPQQIVNYHQNQMKLIKTIESKETLIIFFNVMREKISGGMLSINRFVAKLDKLVKDKEAVVISNIPLRNACINNPFYKHAKDPIDFKYICQYTKPKKIVINIPEAYVSIFLKEISAEMYKFLFSIEDLRINILNQNRNFMPNQDLIERLRTLSNNKVSITCAKRIDVSIFNLKKYKVPLLYLKPFLPNFKYLPFDQKENIVLFSIDKSPYKKLIKQKIKKLLPNYKVKVIQNMSLDEYKDWISKAKYTITFGEGWDGYFLEPYYSGSIAFSVYNNIFFPTDFKSDFLTIFKSYDELADNVIDLIKRFDSDPNLYSSTSKNIYEEIVKFTNSDISDDCLNKYYDFLSKDYVFNKQDIFRL